MGATRAGAAGIAALHPLGRTSTPAEIASFCVYLLSAEAGFVTGSALAIDGGFTARRRARTGRRMRPVRFRRA